MEIALDPEKIQKLNLVRSAFRNRVVTGTFPDFMILGPQRTGTTWLHSQLERHPSIYLSFPKELYYFNRLQGHTQRKFSKHFDEANWRQALLGTGLYGAAREIAKVFYFDLVKTGNLPAHSIEWYLRFFDESSWGRWRKQRKFRRMYDLPYAPKVYGEATASYAAMDEALIQDIVSINPNLKGIIVIRDPVERAWSHAKKDLMLPRNRSLEQISTQEFIAFFTDEYQLSCANYMEQLRSWRKHLAPEHLLVCFYDDIRCKPKEVLLDVFSFLGVQPSSRYVSRDVKVRVNPTVSVDMPPLFRAFLEELFADRRKQLEVEFDRKWPWM